MNEYLLIESHDALDSGPALRHFELAASMAGRGHPVAVFLVQNAVLPTRRGARAPFLDALVRDGVEVLADDFSLRERGIASDHLRSGVTPTPIESVVDRLARRVRVIWH